MDDIYKYRNFWTAKDNYGDFHKNFLKRFYALNEKFFNDKSADTQNWNFKYHLGDCFEYLNCICGHPIKDVYIVNRDDVQCIIGNHCIKRFFRDEIIDKLNKEKRKTFDCDKCNKKRINKETLYHKKCKECSNEIDCIYNYCDEHCVKFGKYKNKSYDDFINDTKYSNYIKKQVLDGSFKENKLNIDVLKRLKI